MSVSPEKLSKELNVGLGGCGDWGQRLIEEAYDGFVDRIYEKRDYSQIPVEIPNPEENFYSLAPQQMFPDDESFYEDLDLLIVANRMGDHGVQVLNALDKMPEDGKAIYEKAASNYPELHKRLANTDFQNRADPGVSLHYKEKSSVLAAQRLIEGLDVRGTERIDVVCKEKDFDEDRFPIMTPPEGGMPWDYGPHAFELAMVNMGGNLPEDPVRYAQGIDTGTGFAIYPEAFEASVDIRGERFVEGSTLNMLMGKNFERDRKQFRIEGNDDKIGDWMIHGYYGTEENSPGIEFTVERFDEINLDEVSDALESEEIGVSLENGSIFVDTSDQPSALEKLIDNWIQQAYYEDVDSNLDLETHAEMTEALDTISREKIGLQEDVENIEEMNVRKWSPDYVEDGFELARKVA